MSKDVKNMIKAVAASLVLILIFYAGFRLFGYIYIGSLPIVIKFILGSISVSGGLLLGLLMYCFTWNVLEELLDRIFSQKEERS